MEDMNINSVKAKVLTAALPYIQKYNGKTVVVKWVDMPFLAYSVNWYLFNTSVWLKSLRQW